MANNCYYNLMAVSKDKAALERLLDIMKYKDSEFFIYRVFSAEVNDNKSFDAPTGIYETEDGYFALDIYGDVAWACDHWFSDFDDPKTLICTGHELKEDGTKDYDKPIYGTAHYTSLNHIARTLGLGIEVWGEEPSNCFQQHFVMNSKGQVFLEDHTSWDGYYADEFENMTEEEKEEAGFNDHPDFVPDFGFGDAWGDNLKADEIYNGTPDDWEDK